MWRKSNKKYEEKQFYEEICIVHYIKILRYCNAHLGYQHEDLAEVCAQNTFLTALENINKLQKHPNVGGWLMITASNFVKRSLQELKKEKMRYVSIDDASCSLEYELPFYDNIDDVIEGTINIEESKDKILALLSKDEYQLYNEYYVDKLGIVHIMNKYLISESAAKSRIFRLKRKISELTKKTI